jgi:hypothetical protein
MLQYLQNYSGKRTNTYYNIYTSIQGRELTHTTIYATLFRGEKKHILVSLP